MKTEIKATYKTGDAIFEMTISEIETEEEFKTAKNTLRREMKYFITDMKDKMPKEEVIEEKKESPVAPVDERMYPTEKQIQTLTRHGITEYNGTPVQYINKEIATQLIKEIFENKKIQPTYRRNSFYQETEPNFPEE